MNASITFLINGNLLFSLLFYYGNLFDKLPGSYREVLVAVDRKPSPCTQNKLEQNLETSEAPYEWFASLRNVHPRTSRRWHHSCLPEHSTYDRIDTKLKIISLLLVIKTERSFDDVKLIIWPHTFHLVEVESEKAYPKSSSFPPKKAARTAWNYISPMNMET